MSYRKLWIALALVMTVSFAVLGGVGIKVLNSAPPIPAQVATPEARVSVRRRAFRTDKGFGNRSAGRKWAPSGGTDLRGAGLDRGLDASRITYILDRWAAHTGAANYAALGRNRRRRWARLRLMMRTNTWDGAGP